MSRRLVGWGYLIELILVATLYLLARLIASPDEIAAFVWSAAATLLGLLGITFAAQVAVFIYYLQKNTGDFGLFLRYRGAERVFSVGFSVPMALTIVASLVLSLATYSSSVLMTNAAAVVVAYAVVNLLTTVTNAIDFMRLGQTFEYELRRHNQSNKE